MMNKTYSDRGRFAVLCYEAIERAGYDAEAFIVQLGFPTEYFRQPDSCYPHDRVIEFWNGLERFTGNPDIGLVIGRHLPSSRGNILSCLFLGAPSFGSALEKNLKYMRILSDALSVSLHTEDDLCYLHIRSHSTVVNQFRHFTECLMLGLIEFYRDVTESRFQPRRIDFACDAPLSGTDRPGIYGCPLHFGSDENRLYFDAALLDMPCTYADPELLRMHENYARNMLRKIEEQDFLVKVQSVIAQLLERGEVTLELASRHLGLNPTELKYRLSTLGTHFIRERENCRRRLVKEMLRKTSESISQIAFTAGFSEPSTFYRAFKRWTHGETPADFRARHQQGGGATQKL